MSASSKSMSSCSEDDNVLRRGPWTLEEDTVLSQYIASHGQGRWNLLAKRSGLRRTGKSCRLRWLNYLKPDVRRGNLTPEEQLLILELHSRWGNRWSKIAQNLPGRTDNEIKNYWRTRVQKQARQLDIGTKSTEFRDFVRSFWMPRLLQKVKESSSSPMFLQYQPFPLPLDTVNSLDSSIEIAPMPVEAYLNSSCQNEQNSDSQHKSSSSNSSSESANFPLGYETSTCQFHGLNNSDWSTFAYDDSFVNNNGYEMETFNLEATRADGDCQVAESNWVINDLACNMWSMDELYGSL